MQNIQVISNELFVKLNYYNENYKLKNKWPLNTIWNINGYSNDKNTSFEYFCLTRHGYTKEMLDADPQMEKVLLNEFERPCYIEVFIDADGVDTYKGIHGKTHEECEEKLWLEFQKYKKCNHKFSRDNSKGIHYSNGVGFCIHCGMSKSNAFLPENVCIECNKPTNSQNVEGKHMCSKCQSKKGFSSYGYISSIISKELLEKEYSVSSWHFDEKTLSFNIDDKLSIQYETTKESGGIYALKLIKFEGTFTIIEHMRFYISKTDKKMYFIQKEALDTIFERIQKEASRSYSFQTFGLKESYNIMKGIDEND